MKKNLFKFGLALSLGTLMVNSGFLESNAKDLKKGYLNEDRYPGEYLVAFKKNITVNEVSSLLGDYLISSQQKISEASNAYLIVLKDKFAETELLNDLQQRSEVRFVEPNFKYNVQGFPVGQPLSRAQISKLSNNSFSNDPSYGVLWGLKNNGKNEPDKKGNPSRTKGVLGADINAEKAWEVYKGSEELVIAVIDTGVDYNHPDLKNQMFINEAEANGEKGVDDDGNGYVDDIYGYDFQNEDGDPMDDHSHGTHCAGTIAAEHDNNEGIAGVMAKAKIMAVKFLGKNGGSTAGAIKSVDYATKMNVDLMSNSWGGGGKSQLLLEAIQRASDKGIVFVAAAGNSQSDNDQKTFYPAGYKVDNVISVAAHTSQDQLASFSSYGKKTVHVAAPGHRILSSVLKNKYAVYSGTSMATPHVSGALGLLIGKEGRMKHENLKERLMMTSIPVSTYKRKVISGGRLEANNLLINKRPKRPYIPKESEWKREVLKTPFESEHPYKGNTSLENVFSIEGAKYLRLIFSKYEIEKKYDWLQISVPGEKGHIDKWWGKSDKEFASEFVEGDKIQLNFESDKIIHKWGFKVIAIEYIK